MLQVWRSDDEGLHAEGCSPNDVRLLPGYAYVVLSHTTGRIFVWSGEAATKDVKAAAARHAADLISTLPAGASETTSLSREEQGQESAAFKQLFEAGSETTGSKKKKSKRNKRGASSGASDAAAAPATVPVPASPAPIASPAPAATPGAKAASSAAPETPSLLLDTEDSAPSPAGLAAGRPATGSVVEDVEPGAGKGPTPPATSPLSRSSAPAAASLGRSPTPAAADEASGLTVQLASLSIGADPAQGNDEPTPDLLGLSGEEEKEVVVEEVVQEWVETASEPTEGAATEEAKDQQTPKAEQGAAAGTTPSTKAATPARATPKPEASLGSVAEQENGKNEAMEKAKALLEKRLSGTFVDPLHLKQADHAKSARSYLADASKAWSAPSGASQAAEVKVLPGERTFSYEELKGLRVESGIDMTSKEAYLDDESFAKVFGKDRAEFLAQPQWRQQLQKKAVGLW